MLITEKKIEITSQHKRKYTDIEDREEETLNNEKKMQTSNGGTEKN